MPSLGPRPSPRRVARVRDDYRWAVGEAAYERQREEAARVFPCCGEARDGAHHSRCRKYLPPEETMPLV